MKKLPLIILILFLSFLTSHSWGETLVCKYTGFNCPEITLNDLVKREGLFYKEFSDIPFTGEITGKNQGSIKDGYQEGEWVSYWSNGQLMSKGEYKDGKEEGEQFFYYDTGELFYKGEYKDGKKVGEWVVYNRDGTLSYKETY